MKVKELIESLKGISLDAEVVITSIQFREALDRSFAKEDK